MIYLLEVFHNLQYIFYDLVCLFKYIKIKLQFLRGKKLDLVHLLIIAGSLPITSKFTSVALLYVSIKILFVQLFQLGYIWIAIQIYILINNFNILEYFKSFKV